MTSAKKSTKRPKKPTKRTESRVRSSAKPMARRRKRSVTPIDPERLLDTSGVPDPHPATELAASRSPAAGRLGRGVAPNQSLGAFPDRKRMFHPGSAAPRAEPSTNGAKQWNGGRRQKTKTR